MNLIKNSEQVNKGQTMLDGFHLPLVGQIATVTEFGVELAEQYEELFGLGSAYQAQQLHWYTTEKNSFKLIFINEPSVMVSGVRFLCLKEMGYGIGKHGDWHWLSLDQLIICSE